MRTTLTIDDDLASQIEELRLRKGLSMKKMIDTLLREGLENERRPPPTKRYRSKTYKLGLRSGFDPVKLNQLADELEADVFRDKNRTE